MTRPEFHVRKDAFGSSVDAVRTVTLKLLAYCQANNWAGHDPYDALNSKLFRALPILDRRLPRLALTQLLKRSPIDFRKLLQVPKAQNPKALALFLSALIKLSSLGLAKDDLVGVLAEKIASLRSPDVSYWCWGYSFPWQTRTIVVPKFAPNLVCTTFVANALLEAHETFGESDYLDMAVSAAEYILDQLYWSADGSTACLSYPTPSSRSRIHNANFLGAALLCRAYRHCGEKKFLDSALKVARYSASQQHDDGSWSYGELPTQYWIDNFHTGYNLCALISIRQYAETTEFETHIHRGFEFYRTHFFRQDGAPKYFHDRTYPIDIHCVAQSIVTLMTFKTLDKNSSGSALSVFQWAMAHMWDEKGYFYYQVLPLITIKISYMRWSQAWMLLALSILLKDAKEGTNGDYLQAGRGSFERKPI